MFGRILACIPCDDVVGILYEEEGELKTSSVSSFDDLSGEYKLCEDEEDFIREMDRAQSEAFDYAGL